jgi:hypothetical protein
LASYAAAGWLAPAEPGALGSMAVRAEARRLARRTQGEAAARAVRDYAVFATHLAFLRSAATRGRPTPDFPAREGELLHHLWSRKAWAQPALLQAAHPPAPMWPGAWPPPPPPPYAQQPYGQRPYGQQTYAQQSYEQPPYTQQSYERQPYAQPQHGQSPYGQAWETPAWGQGDSGGEHV